LLPTNSAILYFEKKVDISTQKLNIVLFFSFISLFFQSKISSPFFLVDYDVINESILLARFLKYFIYFILSKAFRLAEETRLEARCAEERFSLGRPDQFKAILQDDRLEYL